MKERLVARLREYARSPLAWILCAAFALHIVGFGWGLPGSDAWEDDGIAPRDFLAGVYETYHPGHYFTYPPVHLLCLSVLTSPIWGLALARAPSLGREDVIATMIQVPTMTALTVVARLVAQAMALGIMYCLAKLAEEVWGKRASLCVALVLLVCAPLTYYAHTSNLDVPYMFWASCGLLETVRAIVRREPRRLRRAVLFAALAVGTKDQAYAIFLLGFPIAMTAWLVLDREVHARRREIAKELAIGLAVAAGVFLLVTGAITNPSGFRARIHFLLGPASQNHAYYAATWAGRYQIMRALGMIFPYFYPWPFAAAIVVGLGVHVKGLRKSPSRLVAGLVPLLGAVSFIVCFNFTARRSEHRFALPEMLLIGVYAGVAFDRLIELYGVWARVPFGGLLAWGTFQCATVDANLILDPRYDVEAWMAGHVAPGDTIEIYGANAYLPRFPKGARVTRVDTSPLSSRNPLPDVVEVQTAFHDIEARKPRFILIPEAWSWRWFTEEPPPGQVVAPEQAGREHDQATRAYFHNIHAQTHDYRIVYLATFKSTVWPQYDIHSSTAKRIHVFERN